MFIYENYVESADYIRSVIGDFSPKTLVILGSGLGFMAEMAEHKTFVPYECIPHFQKSTAPGHAGRFVFGKIAGINVMMMQGRMHVYEGYTAQQAAYPVRVAKLLGVTSMVVTNAAGAVNTSYRVGELMLISDHMKFFDPTPLSGPNISEFGPRFCDMTYTYCPDYRALARDAAARHGVKLNEGAYCYFPGPQFETPAEIRAVRVLGADAVGMSTVHEAIAANHCGIRTLGISLVTNMAAGILEQKLDEVDVLEAADKAKDGLSRLILDCLPRM